MAAVTSSSYAYIFFYDNETQSWNETTILAASDGSGGSSSIFIGSIKLFNEFVFVSEFDARIYVHKYDKTSKTWNFVETYVNH